MIHMFQGTLFPVTEQSKTLPSQVSWPLKGINNKKSKEASKKRNIHQRHYSADQVEHYRIEYAVFVFPHHLFGGSEVDLHKYGDWQLDAQQHLRIDQTFEGI